MDVISQFQQQLSAPVYDFVGAYWPFLAVIGFALITWFLTPRWRDNNGVVISMTLDGDADGDGGGDGGDSGGGDGGGGGD